VKGRALAIVLRTMDLATGAAVLAVRAVGLIGDQISHTRRQLGLHFRYGPPAELRELLPRFRATQNAAAAGR
jgi:hypothetical protein